MRIPYEDQKMMVEKPLDIDAYIRAFSPDVQEILQAVHATIRKAAPFRLSRMRICVMVGLPFPQLVLYV